MSGYGFEFNYVLKENDLKKEFERRAKENVREKARKYLLDHFGFDIDEVSNPIVNEDNPNVCIYRHHASPYKEGIVSFLMAEFLDTGDSSIITYSRDHYHEENESKRSIINIRILSGNDSGGWFIGKPKPSQVLSDIKTEEGIPVYMYHYHLLTTYNYPLPLGDISNTFSDFLAKSLQHLSTTNIQKYFPIIFVVEKDEKSNALVRKPYKFKKSKKVYGSKVNDKEYSVDEIISLAEKELAYPTAKTYYEELLLFLPGVLFPLHAQLVTPFEEDDEKIRNIAKKGAQKVKEITGEYPLWVLIPKLEEQCLYILENKESLLEYAKRKLNDVPSNYNTYEIAQKIEEAIYEYVRKNKDS